MYSNKNIGGVFGIRKDLSSDYLTIPEAKIKNVFVRIDIGNEFRIYYWSSLHSFSAHFCNNGNSCSVT